MTDWGVPNWQNAEDYAAQLTVGQWWWEFTRRRPDYRALWLLEKPNDELLQRYYSTGATWLHYPRDRHALLINFQLNALLDPTRNSTEIDASSHRWSLNSTVPTPSAIRSRTMEEARASANRPGADDLDTTIAEAKAEAAAAKAAGVVAYTFDLSKPLSDQLKSAEATLLFWQQRRFGKLNTRRPNEANWPLYLRALDAKDGGATFAIMAATFWPGQQKTPQSARDTWKAASELRDNFPI